MRVRVRCAFCRAVHEDRVREGHPAATEAAQLTCQTCGRRGSVRIAETVPIGLHEAPPDDRDEAEDVALRRGWRAEARAGGGGT